MSVEEFVALADAPRAELVDGLFERVELGDHAHARTNVRLTARLGNHVLSRALGDVYDCSVAYVLRLDPPLVRSPDVSFVRQGKDDPALPPGSVPLAPDLAVETLSPSERAGTIQRKVREYLEHGTDLVWLIDPQHRTATIYTRGGGVRWIHEGDTLEGSDVIPGFSVPLAFLFEELAPPT